jgi:cytochrome c551/c552
MSWKSVSYMLTALAAAGIGNAGAADDFDRGLQLARQKGCMDCHALGRAEVGPSFADVARRYRHNPDYRKHLVPVIRGGSAGHWGDRFVMWPQVSLTDQEVRQLVDWVLSQQP